VQQHLFPIYFSLQSVLPATLALTWPGSSSAGSGMLATSPAGISGVLHASNRWTVLAPLATMFVTGLLNLVVLLPATTGYMAERRAQGKKKNRED
jgi:hypothetical protein